VIAEHWRMRTAQIGNYLGSCWPSSAFQLSFWSERTLRSEASGRAARIVAFFATKKRCVWLASLSTAPLPGFVYTGGRMDWQTFWLTIRLAVVVTAVLLVAGLSIAYWIAYSRWRWKFLVEALVAMPIVLPPTVLGFYVLVALGSRSPFGRWWQALTGHTLAFTFAGLVIGSVIYSLPFAVQPFATSFALVDRRLIAASATLGASKLQTFFRVVLPLSVPGLVTGVALTFAHTMGEFGVVLMVGGNIPGVTRTVSIDIYDQVQAFNYSAASETALVLLVISFASLCLVYGVNRKVWALWRWK
jgi:molybdate transport system permease protein